MDAVACNLTPSHCGHVYNLYHLFPFYSAGCAGGLSGLETLILSNCRLGFEGVRDISLALLDNHSLVHLDLSKNIGGSKNGARGARGTSSRAVTGEAKEAKEAKEGQEGEEATGAQGGVDDGVDHGARYAAQAEAVEALAWALTQNTSLRVLVLTALSSDPEDALVSGSAARTLCAAMCGFAAPPASLGGSIETKSSTDVSTERRTSHVQDWQQQFLSGEGVRVPEIKELNLANNFLGGEIKPV